MNNVLTQAISGTHEHYPYVVLVLDHYLNTKLCISFKEMAGSLGALHQFTKETECAFRDRVAVYLIEKFGNNSCFQVIGSIDFTAS